VRTSTARDDQKIFNFSLVVSLSSTARSSNPASDIVGGNREKLTALIWELFSEYKLPTLITCSLLEEELRELNVVQSKILSPKVSIIIGITTKSY
jgi:hypothetical protein